MATLNQFNSNIFFLASFHRRYIILLRYYYKLFVQNSSKLSKQHATALLITKNIRFVETTCNKCDETNMLPDLTYSLQQLEGLPPSPSPARTPTNDGDKS